MVWTPDRLGDCRAHFGPSELIGVVAVESSTANRFDHSAEHFVQGVANVIGTALLD